MADETRQIRVPRGRRAVLKQPNMESDSLDASYALPDMQKPLFVKLPKVVSDEIVDPQETQREVLLSDEFELLRSALETSLCELQNSSKQIHEELISWCHQLRETMCAVQAAEQKLDIKVKLWLADVREVLCAMEDTLDEIMTAKVSRFLHYYRDKKMASKIKDITVRLQCIRDEAEELGLQLRSPPSYNSDPKNLGRKQFAMLNAIYKGKFWKVRGFFENNPDAISKIFENGQTALHVAITAGQLRIAKELITRTGMVSKYYLGMKDKSGNTALSLAACSGMMEIAKCLIEKNKDLLTIPDVHNKLPVQLACRAGHEDMTRYLYCNTPQEFLDGDYGFHLLEECITRKMFDIALHLLHCFPKFAIYRFFEDSSIPIISTLAQTPPPFFRGNQLTSWRRWIYKCITVKVDERNILSGGIGIVAAQKSGTLVSILLKFLAKQIYGLKLMDAIANEIIHFICQRLLILNKDEFVQSGAVEATFQAIEHGNLDIVIEITEVEGHMLWNSVDPEYLRKMFACAVAHRQEEVAQFLHGVINARMGTYKVFTTDEDRNNLLGLAAKLAPHHSQHDCISNAALQLQRELRWFKEVESIVAEYYKDQKNKNGDGETPYQVFVEEHKQLLQEAEEWMKKTAESSTIVGALIITIMFAAAFIVPGGNYQNTGLQFMLLVVSDAISLFAASSSVLTFWGILTSHCAYTDFLKSLPVKLIIGIFSLFVSIVAMMVASGAALIIMLQGRLWISIPVTLFAGIPVIIFVLLQFPFLVQLYTSTFRQASLIAKPTST